MTRILFIRHAESTANVGDVAFGNIEAPLTENALQQQIPNMRMELIAKYGINPSEYGRSVIASMYNRTYQTATELGFRNIDRSELLNESEIYNSNELAGVNIIQKHVNEGGWIPEEELQRARQIIENIRNGSLTYEIIFTHGMVIAGIISELNNLGLANIPFDSKRGYVPLQAQVIQVEM